MRKRGNFMQLFLINIRNFYFCGGFEILLKCWGKWETREHDNDDNQESLIFTFIEGLDLFKHVFSLFIWLHQVLVVTYEHVNSTLSIMARELLSCSMWDLVPWSGIEPGHPALGAWWPSHWTTREVPKSIF